MNKQDQVNPPDRLHRAKSAQKILGISKSKFYEMVAKGDIPAGLRLGAWSVAWRESTLMNVIDNLPSNAMSAGNRRRVEGRTKVSE